MLVKGPHSPETIQIQKAIKLLKDAHALFPYSSMLYDAIKFIEPYGDPQDRPCKEPSLGLPHEKRFEMVGRRIHGMIDLAIPILINEYNNPRSSHRGNMRFAIFHALKGLLFLTNNDSVRESISALLESGPNWR